MLAFADLFDVSVAFYPLGTFKPINSDRVPLIGLICIAARDHILQPNFE